MIMMELKQFMKCIEVGNKIKVLLGGINMTHNERLSFMRDWLTNLQLYYPEEHKKEIECLSWAIKQCKKNVDRKRDKKSYW